MNAAMSKSNRRGRLGVPFAPTSRALTFSG